MTYEFRLEPGVRSVLANFDFTHQARECSRVLQAAGFSAVQIDRVSRFPHKVIADTSRPVFGDAESQSENVLAGQFGDDSGIMLAASNDASAMAGTQEPRVRGLVLTVLCPEERVDECVQIIERHGGTA